MDTWAGEDLLGDEIPEGSEIMFTFWNLREGDILFLISRDSREEIPCGPGRLSIQRTAGKAGYLRAEIRRSFLKGYPHIPVL
ncbi:hypothetical protein HP393_21780, partial [Clostridioides difficile]|nr:hypothetical protein [Clostridioides difficile]